MRFDKLCKLLATISFVFIASVLYIIAITPPASGYELSIYDAYPSYFWFLIIGAITCGIGILVHQAFSEQKSRWWLAGFFAIIFSNLIILSLPFFRGYELYGRADTLSHLGHMKDILLTGYIGSGNFYPMVHILEVSLQTITGLPQNMALYLLFPIFTTLFMLNVYLLATAIASRRGQALLIMAFASPLIFSFYHVHIHPFALSLFMVPLLLYCYHRREQLSSNRLKYSIMVALLAVLITFFHPTTALLAIAIFLAFGLSSVLYRLVARHKKILVNPMVIGKSWAYIAVSMSILFSIWYFSFSGFERNFQMISTGSFDITEITPAVGPGPPAVEPGPPAVEPGPPAVEPGPPAVEPGPPAAVTEIIAALRAKELTPPQTFRIFVSRYGAIFIYLFTSLAAVILILKQSISRKGKLAPMSFAYGLQFLLVLSIAVFCLFSRTPILAFPVRIASSFLITSVILNGLVAYTFAENKSPPNTSYERGDRLAKYVIVGVITLIIVSSSIISVFNVYFSPKTYVVNYQVTEMEITGIQWFTEYHEEDVLTAKSKWLGVSRFETLIYGVKQGREKRAKVDPEPVPSHFGYDQNASIAETFGYADRYMLTTKLDRVAPMAYPENARRSISQYMEADFARLNSDPAVAGIYRNGEFEVWRIDGD